MHQVGHQEIGIELFVLLQTGEQWVREQGVVLKDGAERELLVVLVIPLGANDVVVNDAGISGARRQALEYVSVFYAERVPRAYGCRQVQALLVGKKGSGS